MKSEDLKAGKEKTSPAVVRRTIHRAIASVERSLFLDPEDIDSMVEDVATALETEGIA